MTFGKDLLTEISLQPMPHSAWQRHHWRLSQASLGFVSSCTWTHSLLVPQMAPQMAAPMAGKCLPFGERWDRTCRFESFPELRYFLQQHAAPNLDAMLKAEAILVNHTFFWRDLHLESQGNNQLCSGWFLHIRCNKTAALSGHSNFRMGWLAMGWDDWR